MVLNVLTSDFFQNVNNFADYKYVLTEGAFTRKGKVSLSSAIKYLLYNLKKTTSIGVNKFIRNEWGDNTMTLTKQGISDRMQHIDLQVYKDMNHEYMYTLYNKADEFTESDDFNVFAIDGSIIELPNAKLTREEFGIQEETIHGKPKASARISCMCDT